MREIKQIEVATLKHGRNWIRKGKIDKAVIEALAVSLRTRKQQIPIITFGSEVIDGNCRLLAAPLVPQTHLEGIVLDHEPTELELLEIQYSIDARRSSVPATQRAAALASMHKLLGCTVTELAARTGDGQSVTAKYLGINGASPEVKALLDQGEIDIERAYMLSQTTDPALIQQAPTLTRDQLRAKIKSKGSAKPDVKTTTVRLAIAGGYVLKLRGPALDLPTLCEVIQEFYKQLRKAEKAGHDIESVQRLLK